MKAQAWIDDQDCRNLYHLPAVNTVPDYLDVGRSGGADPHTPRRRPQIVVPVMDVMIEYPGASSEEVEKLVATRWRFCLTN